MQLLDMQAGVISTGQLIGAGVTSRVIDRLSLAWERVSPGIYLTRPPIWESAAWAGLLRAGDGAAVGGLAACFLEGALRDAPRSVLIWAERAKSGFHLGPWSVEFRRGTRPSYRFPPRTRIHASLLDVASTSNELDTAATMTSALSRGVAEPGRLLDELGSRAHQRHRSMIETLCDPTSKGVHSLIEWVFLRDVVRAHRLPEPELQVTKSAGRVDQLYDRFDTIVELGGIRDHSDWSKDMYRDNEHLLEHHTLTLRYGLNDVMGRPCAVSSQVLRRFRSRGWRGRPKGCRRC